MSFDDALTVRSLTYSGHGGMKLGGQGWIRTTVAFGGGFTVRSLRPLGHLP